MATGTSIRIFLPDGNPDGVRLIFKSHWTGIALAAPRSRYARARLDRSELRTPGVYILVGPPESAGREARIYVGEGEDPRDRLDRHYAAKDFWNRFVVFTSFGQTLNKATIRYLEARLLEQATRAGRVELDNGNVPSAPPLSEPERVDAEAFLDDMLVIYPLLGINVFEPLEQAAGPDRLQLEGPLARGDGAETDDGFVVFRGALARAATVESVPGWAVNLRESLVESGALVPIDGTESLRLTTDHVFKSPSAAAAVLLGRSAAGPLEWRDASGRTLRVLREQSVGVAGDEA